MSDNAASPLGMPVVSNKAPNQGALEKRDPLPRGRYWVYLDDSELEHWQQWVSGSGGAVKTIVTEEQRTVARFLPIIFLIRPDWTLIESVAGYWVLFDVLEPVKWVGFGYPTTVVDPAVRSSTDIATAPVIETDDDNPILAFLRKIEGIVLVGVGVYVGVQVLGLTKGARAKLGAGRAT